MKKFEKNVDRAQAQRYDMYRLREGEIKDIKSKPSASMLDKVIGTKVHHIEKFNLIS